MLKFFFTALMIFMLMNHVEAGNWSPELRIGILSGVSKVSVEVSAPCFIIDAEKTKTPEKIAAGKSFVIEAKDLNVDAIEIRPEKILLRDLQVAIDGKKYLGGLRINKVKGGLTVINIIPIEEYLRGVVPEEMSPSYPLEALKTQAVAARSFAMKNRNRHEKDGYDLCSSTHCQVYVGIKEAEVSDEAITETRGEVLKYGGKLADTNFHADSGGMTENVGDVWGTAAPYLIAVKEIIQLGEPWTRKFSAADFSSRFGDNFGSVKEIRLSKLTIGTAASDRSASGRVKTAQIVGTKRTLKLAGTELRRKFSLPSTLFDMKLEGDAVIFTGYGSGHGVGMAQKGAKSYAENGWTYDKILAHYYNGTKLSKLY